MDTTRGILFLVVTLIIIVSIYYIVKMVKGQRTPSQPSTSPSPSDQTDEISISDLKFERTLNPDKSNSKGGDIVGYTIEYAGVNYEELSKNVTFTLGWKNNIGFTGEVKGFNIEHYVKGVNDTSFLGTANQSIDFDRTIENAVVNIENFGENSVSIVSDGGYSVVGKNRFKISAIMNNGTKKLVYNGLEQSGDGNEIGISEQDLGATLEMTEPQTVTYTPVTNSLTTSKVEIVKIKYKISNGSDVTLGYSGSGSIYLLPAYGGTTDKNTNKKIDVDTFFFKHEVGENQYLLYDGTNGTWNKSEKRFDDDTQELNADNVDQYDNRMYVSFYNKDGNTTQLRAPVTGRGTGGKFLTSDESNAIILKDLSSEGTISEKEFTNSYWTFEEVQGDPVNCDGYYGGWSDCSNDCGDGTKTRTYNITTQPRNNGESCPPATETAPCYSTVGCPSCKAQDSFIDSIQAMYPQWNEIPEITQAICDALTNETSCNNGEVPESYGSLYTNFGVVGNWSEVCEWK